MIWFWNDLTDTVKGVMSYPFWECIALFLLLRFSWYSQNMGQDISVKISRLSVMYGASLWVITSLWQNWLPRFNPCELSPLYDKTDSLSSIELSCELSPLYQSGIVLGWVPCLCTQWSAKRHSCKWHSVTCISDLANLHILGTQPSDLDDFEVHSDFLKWVKYTKSGFF